MEIVHNFLFFLLFQRYYELIRHQKQHCFKEEDAKRSAQAQKAAAAAAASFNNQQLGTGSPAGSGSNYPGMPSNLGHSDDSNSSMDRTIQSPMMFHHNFQDKRRSLDGSDDWSGSDFPQNHSGTPVNFPGVPANFPGAPHTPESPDKKMTPSMFDQLTRGSPGIGGPVGDLPGAPGQHPGPAGSPSGLPAASAAMAASIAAASAGHQGLFPKLTAPSTLFPSYPPSSPFGILQQQAGLSNPGIPGIPGQQSRDRDSDEFDTESVGSSPSSASNKRKHSDDGLTADNEIFEKDDSGQPRDKR